MADNLTFIDLFAGIGGMRQAFDSAGAKCVFTSEWDKFAQKTYQANFGPTTIHGDITKIAPKDIPEHDILVGGFPCQAFSMAGKQMGFLDKVQGTLFFNVAAIIKEKRPKAFMLENVKNLMSHDGGKTFATILGVLKDELGYNVHYKLLASYPYVPQKRVRIVIVGFREKIAWNWDAIKAPVATPTMKDILEPVVASKYILSDNLWVYLKGHAAKHAKLGHGFGYGLVGEGDIARTLSARYYKDGSEILVSRGASNPRRLTPRECARLQGFPDTFKIVVSDCRAYKQLGNSVTVPLMANVAKQVTGTIV